MIITCQLPLENCRGDSEIQSQAFTWLAGIVGFVFFFLNPCRQTPLHSSDTAPGAGMASAASVPQHQSWLLLSLRDMDKC